MTSDLEQLSQALAEDTSEERLKKDLERIVTENREELAAALTSGAVFEDEKSGLKISAE